jgi:hypothetical protein
LERKVVIRCATVAETDEKRRDDLSVIMDVIQKSSDDIKNLLVLRAGDTSATTFLVGRSKANEDAICAQ